MFKFYVPHDIIYCILARLSAKELTKLKCVSKSWLSTIESSEFIKFHIVNYSLNSKSQKLICSNWEREGIRYGSRASMYGVSGFLSLPEMFLGDKKTKFPEKIQCPLPFYEKNCVVGTSRGILCIVNTKGRGIFLCNPWIRECRKLPACHLESFPKQRDWIYNVYGFGYDEINDDFKVVKLSGVQSKFFHQIFKNEGKIYSLKSNKWKSIENLPRYIFDRGNYSSGFLFNHFLHWIFDKNKEFLFSLDIRTGEHILLPLSDDFRNDIYLSTGNLGEFNGCLCIFKCIVDGVKIWSMKDYGVKDSWIKHEIFVSSMSLCTRSRVIRYTKNESEEQLVFAFGGVLYFFDGHEQKVYGRENIFAQNYFFSIETLVRLCHYDKSGSKSRMNLYKRKRS